MKKAKPVKKKYGIKKGDPLNWCIFSRHKNDKGKIVEENVKFYHGLEECILGFIDFKVGRKLINKDLDEKKIIKAIDKAKKEVLKELKKVK